MIAAELGGEIALDVHVRDGRVADVAVRSTRRTDIARVLRGVAVEQAIRAVPALFTVCAAAQATAAIGAYEAAVGLEASAMTACARRLMCLLEAVDNHAFEVCTTWPRLVGNEPAIESLLGVRRATGALRRWAFGDHVWAKLGGAAVAAARSPEGRIADLRAAIDAIAPVEALAGGADLRAWARTARDPAAALIGAVIDAGAERFGHVEAPLLPTEPDAWFAARLAAPSFSARPTLDGTPAETGPIARAASHPAVARHLTAHGRGLLARFVARLADARAHVDAIADCARDLRPTPPIEITDVRPSGHGTHVVETTRGPLAHAIEIHAGRVVAWRTVAPTEWSFHPEGVVREALLGAETCDLDRRARFLVAALDPCVPCGVHVVEAAHA